MFDSFDEDDRRIEERSGDCISSDDDDDDPVVDCESIAVNLSFLRFILFYFRLKIKFPFISARTIYQLTF